MEGSRAEGTETGSNTPYMYTPSIYSEYKHPINMCIYTHTPLKYIYLSIYTRSDDGRSWLIPLKHHSSKMPLPRALPASLWVMCIPLPMGIQRVPKDLLAWRKRARSVPREAGAAEHHGTYWLYYTAGSAGTWR